MKKFEGLGVAMATPFNADGSIDFRGLTNLTEHIISGANYLVVMGTTGENPTLSTDEQLTILKHVKQVNNGRLPIVFGIGGNNTANVIDKLKTIDLSGVDAILSVGPYYSKPSQEGVYQHFKAISENTPLPVIIYNVPGRTGMTISAETTLKISELPNIIATKEASGSFDIAMDIVLQKSDNFMVISGDDNYTLPFISIGMRGVISVVGNAYPVEFGNMVRLALDGKYDEARALHYQLLPMMKAIFYDGNPGGIKYVLSKLGICQNQFRLPVVPVNQGTEKALDVAMKML